MRTTLDIRIKSLSPELLEDFFTFFEGVEFPEHPHWSACYCYSFHFTGPNENWCMEGNRAAVEKLVGEERMKGYLAYHEGKPVGWCNSNNRLNYQRLVKFYDLVEPDHLKICSIVCFLIHPDYRLRGITHQILGRVIKDYSALEYETIEAYPGKGKLSAEDQYKGPLELYLKNGFEKVREYENYTLVRRSLINE